MNTCGNTKNPSPSHVPNPREKPPPKAHTVWCAPFPQPLFCVQYPYLSSYARPKYRSGPPLPQAGTTERDERVSPTAVVFRMGGSKPFDCLSRSRSIIRKWSHMVTWRASLGQDHPQIFSNKKKHRTARVSYTLPWPMERGGNMTSPSELFRHASVGHAVLAFGFEGLTKMRACILCNYMDSTFCKSVDVDSCYWFKDLNFLLS